MGSAPRFLLLLCAVAALQVGFFLPARRPRPPNSSASVPPPRRVARSVDMPGPPKRSHSPPATAVPAEGSLNWAAPLVPQPRSHHLPNAAHVSSPAAPPLPPSPNPIPSPLSPTINSEDQLVWPSAPTALLALRDAAVVVLAHNRPAYLRATLASLRSAELSDAIATYVSQDGDDTAVREVAQGHPGARYLHKPRPRILGQTARAATAHVAAHYKWALDQLFFDRNHTHVIVLEDDMEVSPDLFLFFEQTVGLLHADPTIWCISTWNDNGYGHFDLPPDQLFRTGYFPGLGWLLRRTLWEELAPKFPSDHWDHWMRSASQHRGRDCVCPFLPRNYNIGAHGANVNPQQYDRFLKRIAHNTRRSVALGDLRHLLRPAYDAGLRAEIAAALECPPQPRLFPTPPPGTSLLVPYKREEYPLLARMLGLMDSARGHFQAVTVLRWRGHRVLLLDRRLSPLAAARPGLALGPHPGLAATNATAPGQPCTAACQQRAPAGTFSCAEDQFDFVNDCAVLQAHFPCAACGREMGRDIPNFIVDPRDRHHGHCLTTEDFPTCAASHASAVRLCPCVPAVPCAPI